MYTHAYKFYILRYFFTPVLTLIMIVGPILTLNIDSISNDFQKDYIIMNISVLSVVFWLNYMTYKLRRFRTSDEGLHIKEKGKEKLIKYTDINWVIEPILIQRNLMIINYKDRNNLTHSFYIIPSVERDVFSITEENACTKYIRNNIIEHNPEYNAASVPPRWKSAVLFYGSIFAFFALNYVIFQSLTI